MQAMRFEFARMLIELANVLQEGGPEMAKLLEIVDYMAAAEYVPPDVTGDPAGVDVVDSRGARCALDADVVEGALKDKARLDWMGTDRRWAYRPVDKGVWMVLDPVTMSFRELIDEAMKMGVKP